MSATDTTTTSDDAETPVPGPKRLQPPQIAILVGVGIAVLVAVSGVAATVFQFHDESPVQREVFGGIPGWLKLVFYTVIPVMFIYGAVMFSYRMRNWQRGNPDKRDITPKNAKKRLETLRGGLYMQTLLRDPAAGIMHSMIYFGFLILLAVTTVLEINHQLPEAAKFLHGDVYKAYAFVGDFGGLRGLDAQREILDRGTRLVRRIEREVGHGHGLLMVRDHLLREDDVGVAPRAHLRRAVVHRAVVMPHRAVHRVGTACGGSDTGCDDQQDRCQETKPRVHALTVSSASALRLRDQPSWRAIAAASTRIASRHTASSECSAGLWLMPFGLRVKIITLGTSDSASVPASWPA